MLYYFITQVCLQGSDQAAGDELPVVGVGLAVEPTVPTEEVEADTGLVHQPGVRGPGEHLEPVSQLQAEHLAPVLLADVGEGLLKGGAVIILLLLLLLLYLAVPSVHRTKNIQVIIIIY